MQTLRLIALLLLAAALPLVAAQTPAPVGRTSPDYVIGHLDKVEVTVTSPFAQPEFSLKPYIVQSDGTIILPHLAKPVKIGGLTVVGAREVIRKALIEAGDFLSPTVDVNVSDYRNSNVTVQGAVRSPGNLALRADRMTIADALAMAGGLSTGAGSRIWVRGGPNRPAPDASTQVDKDNGMEVFRKDDVLQGRVSDARVWDGDTITVEVAPHFYVTGYVKNSTSEYNWEPNITLQKAIALAGGASPEGALNRITISRKDPKSGRFKDAKFAKGDKMATLIEPDDVIKVPKKRM